MKRLFCAVSIIVLAGAGCASNASYGPQAAQPANVPDAAELLGDVEKMTPEQLAAAMEEDMHKNPPQYLTDDQMKQEESAAASTMSGTKISSGAFAAKAHRGAGGATVVRRDGSTYLVLDAAFATDAGPRLHVFLTGHPDPANSADVHSAGDADLGPLKATSGAQVYEIPATAADGDWKSVVVYCVPFKVVFTSASLR